MSKCVICQSTEKDDIRYGEFIKKKNVGVHTYCLYLSSNLCQNGGDNAGFLGFLLNDIKKEVERIRMSKCCYCRDYYANIGCCHKKCRNTFHLVCGIKNGAQNEFCDTFRSFCRTHVRKVRYHPRKSDICFICYENLMASSNRFDPVNMLRAPCCHNGWFHKYCLQKCAKMSGYFFKCPLCNDTEKIKSNLKKMGVFIPDQDAAWELEPGAFQDLLERPRTCQAIDCKNEAGRDNETDSNPFKICITCGSVAVHENCMQNMTGNFQCDECFQIIGSNVENSNQNNVENNKFEDSYVDVCNTDDSNDDDIPLSIRFKNEISTNSPNMQTKCHLNNEMATSDEDEEIIAPKQRNKFHVINDDFNNIIKDKQDCSSSDEDLITSFIYRKNVIASDESSCGSPKNKRRRRTTTVCSTSTDSFSDSESMDPLALPSRYISAQKENQLQQHMKHTPSAQQANMANDNVVSKPTFIQNQYNHTSKFDNKKESHEKYILSALEIENYLENNVNKFVEKHSNKLSYLSEIKKLPISLKNAEQNVARVTQKTSLDCHTNKENIQHNHCNLINPSCLQENKLNHRATKTNIIKSQPRNCSKNRTLLISNRETSIMPQAVSEMKNVTVRVRRLTGIIRKTDVSKQNNNSNPCCSEKSENNDSSSNNRNNIPIQNSNGRRHTRLQSLHYETNSNFKCTNSDPNQNYMRKTTHNIPAEKNSKQNNINAEKLTNTQNFFQGDHFNRNCENRRITRSVSKSDFVVFETSHIANRTRTKSANINDKTHLQNFAEITPSNSKIIQDDNSSLSATKSSTSTEGNHYSLTFYSPDDQSKNKRLVDHKIKQNKNITTERAVHLQFYTEVDAYTLPKFNRVGRTLKRINSDSLLAFSSK